MRNAAIRAALASIPGLAILASCADRNVSAETSSATSPAIASVTSPGDRVLFDDFSYQSQAQFERNGWISRTKAGWPGVPGAEWTGNVTVGVAEPANARNRVIRLTAGTDGKSTRQAQFCHQRKYFEGTYAARVRWADTPVNGPDGDQIVETFYMIAPLRAPLDTAYSELDFEYLANGGWGEQSETLFVTTWETFNPEPLWLQINKNSHVRKSREGWHTLVVTVADNKVTYYIDDELLGEHGGPYYPEEPMSINFNLWFIRDGLAKTDQPRRWEQDVDWVFHEADKVLSPAQVRAKIEAFRKAGTAFRDTVPPRDPPLNSPCDF